MISPMGRLVVVTTGGTIATSSDDAGVKRPTRSGADLTAGLDVEVDTPEHLDPACPPAKSLAHSGGVYQ